MAFLKGILEGNQGITLPKYVCQSNVAQCGSRMATQTNQEETLKDDQGITVFVVDVVLFRVTL
jgi:hypothetical protein